MCKLRFIIFSTCVTRDYFPPWWRYAEKAVEKAPKRNILGRTLGTFI